MLGISRREFLVQTVSGASLSIVGTSLPRIAVAQEPKGIEPYPIAVAVGAKGTIYVADKALKTVYRVDEGGKLFVIYKGSRKYRTPLFNVMAMAADSAGNLFLCDTGSMDVWRLAPDGKLTPLTGKKIARGIGPAPTDQDFDPEAAYAGEFSKPMGIAIDPDGNLIVADLGDGGYSAIYRLPAAGGKPTELARVPAPHGVALDREGGFVVVSQAKDQLVRVSAAGEVTPIVKGRIADKNNPHHVVVDGSGYIVSDNYAKAIWRITPDGKSKAIVQGDPLVAPVGLALDADGSVLVADPWAKKIFRVTTEGKISEVVSLDAVK
jgi:sugar lactone lactonase YvrE